MQDRHTISLSSDQLSSSPPLCLCPCQSPVAPGAASLTAASPTTVQMTATSSLRYITTHRSNDYYLNPLPPYTHHSNDCYLNLPLKLEP
jgi:hypothetical protein